MGYALSGDGEEALNRTLEVFSSQDELAPRLCKLWEKITGEDSPPADIAPSILLMVEEMQCSQIETNEPGQ